MLPRDNTLQLTSYHRRDNFGILLKRDVTQKAVTKVVSASVYCDIVRRWGYKSDLVNHFRSSIQTKAWNPAQESCPPKPQQEWRSVELCLGKV